MTGAVGELAPRVVPTARGPVEVAEAGHGPAVVVVHGSPGDWGQGRALAEDLAPSHRVVLVSRPGYGATPLRVGRTPEDQAAALAAVLDTLGEPRAALIAISGGGPAAYAFATRASDRCTALVLCCAVAVHLPVAVITRLVRTVYATPWARTLASRYERRSMARLVADPALLAAAITDEMTDEERARAERDPRILDDLRAFMHDRARAVRRPEGFRNDVVQFHSRRGGSASPWPTGVRVPTLILHGDADPVVDIAHAEFYARAIPDAEFESVQGGGHAFVLTYRSEVTPRIARFLDRAQTSSPPRAPDPPRRE